VRLKHLLLSALLAASAAGAQAPDAGPGDDEPGVPAFEQAEPATHDFRLGRHYNRLSPTQPTSSGPETIEVAEVFWYGCPYCYAFEPHLERWRESMPSYVSFVRIPAVWNPLVRLHARAFYAAEELGKTEELHGELFRAIHEAGNPLDSQNALQTLFGRFGVDEEAFRTAFDSFAVHTRLERAEELARRYRVASVPVVVVNGKYTADANTAGGYERLIELIEVLVAMEATRED
jgi:protein dithiol oxidoreductase (disulfide-forming)